MKSHWIQRQTCGAFVVARGVRLNIGRAVSSVNSVACCKLFVGFLLPVVFRELQRGAVVLLP